MMFDFALVPCRHSGLNAGISAPNQTKFPSMPFSARTTLFKLSCLAVFAFGSSISAHAATLTEDFNADLPAWESGWFGQHSNASNYCADNYCLVNGDWADPSNTVRGMAGSGLVLSSDASQSRGWAFTVDGEVIYLRPSGRLDCTDGQVLHAWCSAGLGLAWRSAWEVEQEVRAGELVNVLADFAAPPNGIYAVFPHAKHLALRVRLWIDFLKHSYGATNYWR